MAAAFACLSCLMLLGCERHKYIAEEMTWQCVPEEYKASYAARPDEYVRFRFIKNPHCEELQSSRNFCAEMRKANRPVVKVEFELWGYRQLHGYNPISVDGRPLLNVGGWASSGARDYSGPCPLNEAFAP